MYQQGNFVKGLKNDFSAKKVSPLVHSSSPFQLSNQVITDRPDKVTTVVHDQVANMTLEKARHAERNVGPQNANKVSVKPLLLSTITPTPQCLKYDISF